MAAFQDGPAETNGASLKQMQYNYIQAGLYRYYNNDVKSNSDVIR